MLKKIVCPTDLSPAARNAVSYAAKMCQISGATLTLVYVEPVTTGQLVFSGRRKLNEVLQWSEQLHQLAEEVSKSFHISCSCDVETANRPLPEVLNSLTDEETLIVAGTNGADNLFQQLFGSNAYNIVSAAKGAVLVIPYDIEFRTVRKISLAWDYKISPALIHTLRELAGDLNAKFAMVHMSEHVTEISKDVFRAVSGMVKEEQGADGEIEFKQVHGHHIFRELNQYIRDSKTDILAISMKSGRLIEHIFGSVGKSDELPLYPVLVLHDQRD